MRRETRDKVCTRVCLGLGLTILLVGIVTPPSQAEYWDEDVDFALATDLPTLTPTPTPPPNVKQVEEDAEEFLGAVKTIPKEEKKESPTSGPPSKQTMLQGEVEAQAIRAMFQKSQLEEAKRNIERAAKSTNPAERQVLLKDAQVKTDNAAFVIQSIVGPPAAAGAAQPGSKQYEGSGQKGGTSGHGRLGEAFRQLQNVMGEVNDAESKTLDGATKRAKEEFKEGRAGAGGVALYKAATMLTPLDVSKMSSATVENGRLVMVYDGQKLRFPALDRQFLAIAIRSVYGGEGLVKGKLLAVEKNSVVLSTGADQYGDVVWKKEFLPGLSESIKPGDEVALDLGPGVGVLSLPEPSHDRVTYYGPLKGNLLGQVVQEADMVFSMFWYGVDWKTGLPLKPAMLPGYVSLIETGLKQPDKPPPATAPKREKSVNWWEDSAWWVWTPDEMTLQLVPQTSEFEFVKSSMKVTVWGVREENLRDGSIEDGAYLSQHYDDFARSFPVLTSLKEAAKTVAVVRWLKQNGVPLDLSWARSFPLTKVNTPDTLQRFSVYIYRDKFGKPQVEAP